MMKLNISLNMDDAAFGDTMQDQADEVWRVLDSIPTRIGAGEDAGTLRDTNGNTIGEWSIATGTAD